LEVLNGLQNEDKSVGEPKGDRRHLTDEERSQVAKAVKAGLEDAELFRKEIRQCMGVTAELLRKRVNR